MARFKLLNADPPANDEVRKLRQLRIQFTRTAAAHTYEAARLTALVAAGNGYPLIADEIAHHEAMATADGVHLAAVEAALTAAGDPLHTILHANVTGL